MECRADADFAEVDGQVSVLPGPRLKSLRPHAPAVVSEVLQAFGAAHVVGAAGDLDLPQQVERFDVGHAAPCSSWTQQVEQVPRSWESSQTSGLPQTWQ